MTFLSRLYPGDAFVLTALNALIQITLVTTLAACSLPAPSRAATPTP